MQRRAKPAWFPRCSTSGEPKLFCFPHAGAGTLSFREWIVPGFAVCPAQYPGREDRAAEPAMERMEDLIAGLAAAILPLADDRSVFFGHMGAGVAFELARALRRSGATLPRLLVVSGARSPQYRLTRGPLPELTDEELSRHVHDLGIPVLRADLRLYRNYLYTQEPPLPTAILAYSGADDPNVTPEQMGEWAVQTSDIFLQRAFSGGHFYLQDAREELLETFASDAVDIFQHHSLYS